jgi:hypothetical protein
MPDDPKKPADSPDTAKPAPTTKPAASDKTAAVDKAAGDKVAATTRPTPTQPTAAPAPSTGFVATTTPSPPQVVASKPSFFTANVNTGPNLVAATGDPSSSTGGVTGSTGGSTTTGGGGDTGGGTTGGGSSGGGAQGGSSSSGGTPPPSNPPSAIGTFFTNLGATLMKACVFATRTFVIPLAESYARPAEQAPPTAGVFTVDEQATLRRAGQKLVCEVGQILVANYPVMPSGTPTCTKDANGQYAEPSIAYLFSGVKAAQTYLQSRAAQQAQQQQQAQAQAQAQQRAPIAVSTLRRTPTK